jgi:hypothetical protein
MDVGIIYHNEIGRFYRIFFTHDLPKDGKFKICSYTESAEFNNIVKNKKRRKMQFL